MTAKKLLFAAFLLLLVNSGYVWAFPGASLLYVGNVVLHIGLGIGLLAAGIIYRKQLAEYWSGPSRLLLIASLWLGVLVCILGATRRYEWVVVAHLAAGLGGGVFLLGHFIQRGLRSAGRALTVALAIAALLPVYSWVQVNYFPTSTERIINSTEAALSMAGEGPGPDSPFFPSPATTNTGDIIPADFFMESESCKECHEDVYDQWFGSMHHFSSFNNQFYRKSIEYMQDTAGIEPSKWCAGCHDHAVFFNGRFDKPIKDQIDTPEAQTGLGCMSCHAIIHVNDSVGNANFTVEYPALHDLATSENPVVRWVHDTLTKTAPEAHRRAFLKPFMRADSAEFCSSCHKVHLDKPVNDYRWMRGFNEYDSWQASGVSGFGARSFYYPAQSQSCIDCHMPLLDSDDIGSGDGQVRSHRFPGANTAVPYSHGDHEQLATTQEFLQNNILSVDIFAVSPIEERDNALPMQRRASDAQRAATSFAVGEEAQSSRAVVIREVGALAAPIDATEPMIAPGDTVKVDVVVRTKTIGHFFPGGTVDATDVWVELQAFDAAGRMVFWSGRLAEGASGPVDRGAEFFRSVVLDERGNPIDKRNAFMARSLLYAQLIPPGAAHVAHYRLQVPEDAQGPLRLVAKVQHRKFPHSYTQFSWAGEPDPASGAEFGKGFDDRDFHYRVAGIPANVSSSDEFKSRIPDLPVTTLAEASTQIGLGSDPFEFKPKIRAEDAIRWNDYGIGLFLQGDLKGAEYAFLRVMEADPSFADGPLNVARALIEEGQTKKARDFIEKAKALDDSLARVHFFDAMIEKAEGDYPAALAALARVEQQYPKDRVVLNNMATIYFRMRRYEDALAALDRVARIDPEDLQMHYTRMLALRGLGRTDEAKREQALFERFKADEDAQRITASARRLSPEDNNLRQPIHEITSIDLTPAMRAPGYAFEVGLAPAPEGTD